ncbi:hypothetical protein PVAND_010961 [Polypedilum vanderplanki]|uniref:Uncharacterized protein n=1 Tax=Polypedilum vanderplanki TaxID=319348 RepID=A0A9J6CII0_POLVA|nr:hypothetical protein PVAND_010961 [Polypedilum vanderplanki]
MERGGRGFNSRGGFRGRGRGMRGGGFSNGPMNGRGGMIRGRGGMRPPRMGLGFQSRGGSRGGRGRFPSQSGEFFQSQQQPNENVAPVQQEPEKPVVQSNSSAPPANSNTSSGGSNATNAVVGNNVPVVTTGPSQTQQTSAPPPSQAAPVSSAPSGNFSSMQPREMRGDMPRGRGFSRGFSRGSFSRGRGNFNQGSMPPRQFDTRQPSNLTPALPSGPPKMSRYDNSIPPKRGRFESNPYNSRNMSQNQPPPMAPQHHQSSYNMPQHGAPNPSGYQDQTSYMDQYQHSSSSGYNSSIPPQSYPSNGQSYGQSYSSQNSQMGYQEYDHNAGYQDYNASSYDTRGYANYSQDYRSSSYGTSTADGYGQVSQDSSYASYETRGGYGNYDSYSQGYNSQSGYY